MKNRTKNIRRGKIRFLCLMLALMAMFASIPVSAGSGAIDSKEITQYVWKKVKSQKDLPADGGEGHLIFVWQSGGTYYYSGGSANYYNEEGWWVFSYTYTDMLGMAVADRFYLKEAINNNADTFTSDTDLDSWYFKVAGTDGSNGGAKRIRIRRTDNKWVKTCANDIDGFVTKESDGTKFTINTPDSGSDYSKHVKSGYVSVADSRDNLYDQALNPTGNRLEIKRDSGDDYANMIMYISTQVKVNDISRMTISDGGTQVLTGYNVIKKSDFLTVTNGSTLIINGFIANNGTILVEKGSTLIVQNGATISWFRFEDPSTHQVDPITGALNIYNSELIIMDGGTVETPSYDLAGVAYSVFENASVFVSGTLVAPINVNISGQTEIQVGENGSMTFGVKEHAGNSDMKKKYLENLNVVRGTSYITLERGAKYVCYSDVYYENNGKLTVVDYNK